MAPPGADDPPTIVLLSPGPYNSAYFEHSFLARHMGIELVFGQDLFVHDEQVFLRTTRGPRAGRRDLSPARRRLPRPRGASAPTSLLGVPDLMKAYRAGNVTLANAVGTGVADDKAIYPFVEDMIRFYLTEEPILQERADLHLRPPERPGVRPRPPRRAGGQGGQRVGRLRHADGAVGDRRSSAPSSPTKLRHNPRNYIAQPVVTLSTCPTWTDEGLAPRHVDLRPYIVSGTSTWVLPGGLTRTALVKGSLVVNSSQGGRQQGHLGHGERPMISRVAEHCFWMSRYLERAENTARVLEVNQTLLLDFARPVEQQWQPLLIISGIHDMPGRRRRRERPGLPDLGAVDNLASIACSIAAARENARIIREVISAEMWERMNYYYLWMQSAAAAIALRQRPQRLLQPDQADQPAHARASAKGRCRTARPGTSSSSASTSSGPARRPASSTSSTTSCCRRREHVGTPVDNAHWVAILMSCSGYEPFHKQRPGADPGIAVADFLIFDSIFPRSVRFCLGKCRAAAYAISGRTDRQARQRGRARSRRPDGLAEPDPDRRLRRGRAARGADQRHRPHPRDRRRPSTAPTSTSGAA